MHNPPQIRYIRSPGALFGTEFTLPNEITLIRELHTQGFDAATIARELNQELQYVTWAIGLQNTYTHRKKKEA
jgi:hypothetical protein